MSTIRTIKNKSGTVYRAEICVDGKRLSERFDSKTAAKEWAATHEVDLRRGVFKDPEPARKKTLAQVLDEYADAATERRATRDACEKEVKRIEMMKRRFDDICDCAMAQLTRERVKDWLRERRAEVSESTVKRDAALLRAAINYAIHERDLVLPRNPFSNLFRHNRGAQQYEGRDRLLSDDERERLRAALDGCENSLMRDAFEIAAETGLRRGELMALEWRDFESPLLHVRQRADRKQRITKGTKGGGAGVVPLTPRAIALLNSLREKNGKHARMFHGLTYNALGLAWQRVLRRAGVENFRWHDLRHAAITRAAAIVENPYDVMQFARHADLRMTQRYVHASVKNIARRFAEHEQQSAALTRTQ